MSRFKHLEMGDIIPEVEAPDDGLIDEQTYSDRADAAFDSENYERALAYYSRALQYDPNLASAWVGQILCLIEMNELPEAVVWSDRALERFPGSGLILAARAIAEARTGRSAEAIGYADSAFKAGNVTAFVWVARGEALIDVHRSNAVACFTKAIELEPGNARIQMSVARAFMVRKMWGSAYSVLQQLTAADPKHARGWLSMGLAAEKMRDGAEALRCFERALSINPELKEASSAKHRVASRGPLRKLWWTLTRRFRR